MLYKWFSTVDGLIKIASNRLQNITGNPHLDLAEGSSGQNDDFRPLTSTLGGRGMGCRDKYVTS